MNKPPRKACVHSKFLTASLSVPGPIRSELTVQKNRTSTPTEKVNAFQLILVETRVKSWFTFYLSVVVVVVVVRCPLVTELPIVALGAVTVEGAQRVDALAAFPAAALLALVHILVTSAKAQAKTKKKNKNCYSWL